MKFSRKTMFRGFLILTILALLGAAANFIFIDLVVDVLWYRSLGFLGLFLRKIGYRYFVLGVVTGSFFLLIFLNFWVASRYLGVTMIHKEDRLKRLIRAFRSGSLKVYTPLSLLLAVLLAMPIYREWENALLLFFATATGSADAQFGMDVSFYLFALPMLDLLQGRVITTLFLLLISLAVLYAAELKVLSREGQTLFRGAKAHLSLVILLIFVVQCLGYGIEALMLQYTTKNMAIFFGPGYAEIHWTLPLIVLAGFLMLPAAVSLIIWLYTRRGLPAVIFFGLLALGAHGVRNWQAIPNSVNRFLVKPNEFSRQERFIAQSIQSTLSAYQLKNVERRPFSKWVEADLEVATANTQLDNIPLWDNELLSEVFQQLQAIRSYYQFTALGAARYLVNEELHQVYLAAREINIDRLPDGAQNWINRRLKYTHGFGAVMVPAAQSGEERMRWYLRNMPPESTVGFSIEQPSIYYGLADQDWIIAPNRGGEFHYPGLEDDSFVESNYQGKGGVWIGNFWRKTLFAFWYRDRNLLFTGQTNRDSRLHFRRNIVERIRLLTPFLELDQNPYLVVTPERLYWIVDAYTTSKWYPNSHPFRDDLNYIRNSVKITVDAYDGQVRFYLSDPSDPIALAYQRMYPGLIRPLEEMPEGLRSQVRYPKDLFEIQMRMFAIYHQENPRIFFQSEDLMQFAEITHQQSLIEMRPYYITLNLLEPDRREFLLLTPLLPVGRDNLRALAVVSSEPENYGEIVLFTFPKGSQVYGPAQVNALIDQNTEIAQSITLWNQQGSEVMRGKMIVLPLEGRILYIQPLYMRATGTLRIPQLKRVIVCADEALVMDFSVARAMERLKQAGNSTAP